MEGEKRAGVDGDRRAAVYGERRAGVDMLLDRFVGLLSAGVIGARDEK